MNKQALAFLTMFSLILMLSVYYVTLPSDQTKTVMKDETANAQESNQQDTKTVEKKDSVKEDTSKKEGETQTSSEATKLQKSINQKKEVEINKNNEIIASEKTEDAPKKEALEKLDTLKQQQTLQTTLIDALSKDGYQSAVEISDTTCIVNVFGSKDNKETAKKILTKVNSLTNNKYLIEVTFK